MIELIVIMGFSIIIIGFVGPILIQKYLLPKYINDNGEEEPIIDTDTKEGLRFVIAFALFPVLILVLMSIFAFYGFSAGLIPVYEIIYIFLAIGIIFLIGALYFTYKYLKL